MAETLTVEIRDDLGKHGSRRLRRAGKVPAILYGHQQENRCLAIAADELEAAVRHGSRLVTLVGALNESALIRELQWDTWGVRVLHADLTRISADEAVELVVPIELRGEAPGVRAGGVIEQLLHELKIECPARSIPDRIEVNVNQLNLGGSITVGQLALPAGAKSLVEADEVVVQCVEPAELPEEEVAAEAGPAEPELIKEKKKEEEESEEG